MPMPFDPMALLGGGLSGLASMWSASENNQGAMERQQDAERFDQQMVTQQQNYQTNMSNTAYQRASADMKAAGLNPMMMFGSGGPASTPSSSAPTIAPAPFQSGKGPAIQQAISTAMQMRTADATVDNLVQENANLKTKNALMGAEVDATNALGSLRTGQVKNVDADTRIKDTALHNVINEAARSDNELEFRRTPAGKLLDQAGMAGRKVSDVLSPVGSIVSSARGVSGIMSDAANTSFKNRYYFGE